MPARPPESTPADRPADSPLVNHKSLHPVWAPCGFCQARANAKANRIMAFMEMADRMRWSA